ncbi:MAG TPA: oligosaccharide flippase family protein [Candidatus Kapabacteria bacterium]|nr:oligosaccharide flippase family protein [Candidatus Kapabacteria bacterium]
MTDSFATISEFQPSVGARIVRGAISAFVLNVLGYGCLFLGQILIARLLTRVEYAEFTVSISFVAIMALVADLGMTPLFTRLFAEAEEHVLAKGEDRRGTLLGSTLALRVALSVIVAALVLLIAPLLYPASMIHYMAILLLALLISSRLVIVRSVGDAVLRGRGKYYLSAVFGLIDAVVFAVLMIVATYRHFTLDQVIWIYVLCNIPGFIMLARSIAQWTRREHIVLRMEWHSMRGMLKLSVPLALGTAFLTIHTQIDNILLYHLSTPLEVSNYGATIRLSAAMSPFPLVLAAVTAPELTRLLHRGDEARARQLTDITLRLLLVSGAAIALVVTALANMIVPLLLGAKYAVASPLFIWTGWMLLPIFIGTLLMEVSIAANRAWFMTAFAGVSMGAVIVGDLLLIPSHGAIGAMASKLIAVTLGAALIVWLSRNSGHLDAGRFTSAFARTGLAAGTALGAFWMMPNNASGKLFALVVALAIYYLIVHFTHVLPIKEVTALLKRIRRPVGNTNL